MLLIETRGNDGKRKKEVGFSEAILDPGASFGGLYAPSELPDMGMEFLSEYLYSDYKTLAQAILEAFDVDIDAELVGKALERYDHFDDPNNPVPVVKIDEGLYVCELYHGPTRAFKDMALQPFGTILGSLAEERGEKYLIMAATSGDTGPATLETFKNMGNIKVTCLYPAGKTSDVQRLQMVTVDAENEKVIGVRGNFDDTQHALKSLLSSQRFIDELDRRGIKLSAANSVNFGRIIFQIIYHIYSYLKLLRENVITPGEKIYIVVPSGNFGNALGAYYAKKAGLPVEKILIASNVNNILTDLITDGRYDLRGRSLIETESPAMDILKSSNVERMLFDKFGPERTKELMSSLDEEGYYELSANELESIREDFDAVYSSDEECEDVISRYASKGYIMDPHTATCLKAHENLRRDENIPSVICSTAEWTKFSPSVAKSLGIEVSGDLEALEKISKMYELSIDKSIDSLFRKDIAHPDIVDTGEIEKEILNFL